jgi:acyl-CoA thioesterase YciA
MNVIVDNGMQLLTSQLIKKGDLGFHGNLFGGTLMAWIDTAAAAYAMEVCRNRRMVTICIDECVFKKPAKEGSMLKIYGKVMHIGSTSIKMMLEARAYNVYTQDEDIILSTSITFVRIDEDGNPIPIAEKVKQRWLDGEFER